MQLRYALNHSQVYKLLLQAENLKLLPSSLEDKAPMDIGRKPPRVHSFVGRALSGRAFCVILQSHQLIGLNSTFPCFVEMMNQSAVCFGLCFYSKTFNFHVSYPKDVKTATMSLIGGLSINKHAKILWRNATSAHLGEVSLERNGKTFSRMLEDASQAYLHRVAATQGSEKDHETDEKDHEYSLFVWEKSTIYTQIFYPSGLTNQKTNLLVIRFALKNYAEQRTSILIDY